MRATEPGEGGPTTIENLAILRELLALWRRPPGDRIAPRLDGTFARAYYTLALAEHATRLTDAVILLAEAGMHSQATPLIRLTLECGVGAAWLSVTTGSADAFARQGLVERRKLGVDLAKVAKMDLSETFVPDLDKMAVEFEDAESAEARYLSERVKSLAGADWLYPFYRHLSAYSHGGSALSELYLRPGTAEWDDEKPFEFTRMFVGIQVMVLHLAIRAWDDLDTQHPMRDELDAIAERLGMSTEIRRADEGKT